MKAKYPEAYDALITHNNRYRLLYEKLVEHTEDTKRTLDISIENIQERLTILHDMIDALLDINVDYQNIIKEFEAGRNITHTALRAYAEHYGAELVVPEGFINFNEKFNLQTSVIPTKGMTTITVEIEEINDD